MTPQDYYPEVARKFSRRWCLEQGRSLLWVAIVSLLIWIYADMEFTGVREASMTLHLTTGKDSNLVLLSPADVEATFRIRGNQSSLEAFESLRKAKGNRVDIDVSVYGPGDHMKPLDELLQRNSDFSNLGLTVMPGSQGLVQFNVDKMITLENVPVGFSSIGATLAKPAEISPSKMPIRLAQSRLGEILKKMPSPRLDTEQRNLQKIEAGRTETMMVDVVPMIAGVPVIPQVPSVQVSVQVEKNTSEYTFSVPVRIASPPSWETDNTWKEYSLLRRDPLEWRKTITVTGAKQDLDLLRSREQDVYAFVILTEDDKKPVKSWLPHRVFLRFPDDVQVKLVGEPPAVDLKLEQRP